MGSISRNRPYISPMPNAKLNRTVIRLSGEGVIPWLDGLITNNLNADITFAALLTPQGKIIADFFVIKDGGALLIDTAEKFADNLIKRLTMYRLRAKIEIEKTDLSVFAAWDGTGEEGHADPRHAVLGRRIIADTLDTTHSADDYDLHRLTLGIPESEWDFETSDLFPADVNMDRLNGVDFKKGCFVGQEVVSRMKRKTTVRKRARGFSYDGSLDGDTVTCGERVVGQVLHTRGGRGMAMMRLDRLADAAEPTKIGDQVITLLERNDGDPT